MLLLLLSHFSCVRLSVTPQTTAHQAPPSLGFSRQEHCSGLPLPSPNRIICIDNYFKCKWIKHQPKTETGWGEDKNVHVCTHVCVHMYVLTISLYLIPQTVCNYFTLSIMFPLWLTIVIIFYFLVWLLIVKTDKHFLLL